MVRSTPFADELEQRAQTLVAEGWNDADAIAALIEQAGSNTDQLVIASRCAKLGGAWMELREQNRVVRLLEAAASGEPIECLSVEQEELFSLIESWASMNGDDAFTVLSKIEPRLMDLCSEMKTTAENLRFNETKSEDEQRTEWLKYSLDIPKKLMSLVGEKSEAEGVIIRSQTAFEFVLTYFGSYFFRIQAHR